MAALSHRLAMTAVGLDIDGPTRRSPADLVAPGFVVAAVALDGLLVVDLRGVVDARLRA
jgi:hypothetical protein